jgi:NAD(P)-dependent dehydrogenase (short-subunit alcohol dehydrogenase family)
MVTTKKATAPTAPIPRRKASTLAPAKPATPVGTGKRQRPSAETGSDRRPRGCRQRSPRPPGRRNRSPRLIRQSPVGQAGTAAQAMVRAGKSSRLRQVVRNKVVVVTGASSGIGEDCALKLAAAGATVILAARTPQKLAETVARIEAQGGHAFAYACDIADLADCDRFCEAVLANHGHVDILINNAGRSIRRSVKHSFDRFHDFERTMQLNFFGALRLIFGFAPTMLARKQGHIINISSIGVLASPPRFSAYVASKAALDAFSWCAASEFADSNVRFTTVNMPLVRTPDDRADQTLRRVPRAVAGRGGRAGDEGRH